MTARHHHYLSQCYLKGFTRGSAKKSKLTVIDFSTAKQFETIPRNVGGIRDFNRIDIEGVDQNIVEEYLSRFESEAATALKHLDENNQFEGPTKELILNLIALLAVRSPEMRENRRQFEAQVATRIMDISLSTKEHWEAQVQQMIQDGIESAGKISYEEIKEFFESNEYDISVATEAHIETEMALIDTVLPYLRARKWVLVRATDETGPFITSDNPVSLTWKEPENIPLFYRKSPGFGLKGTQVYFPVSKDLALIGEFDGNEAAVYGDRNVVSLLNTKVILMAYRQIYCPKLGFYFHKGEEGVLDGSKLLKNGRDFQF